MKSVWTSNSRSGRVSIDVGHVRCDDKSIFDVNVDVKITISSILIIFIVMVDQLR